MNESLERVFEYEGSKVRTVVIDGEPWFVAVDVCRVLEHTNTSVAVSRLDDDEKGVSTLYTPGGTQGASVVSEAGLYSLILTSRKPEAKAFKRWITHEVIPAIRKTGTYVQPATSMEDLIIMQAQSVKELKAKVDRIEATANRANATTAVLAHRVDNLDLTNIEGTPRQRLEKMMRRYAWSGGLQYPAAWRQFDGAYNTSYHRNLTRLRNSYAIQHGLRSITRPAYLEATGQIEDAIRVADKLLNAVRKAAG